jgi:hypothetical protein
MAPMALEVMVHAPWERNTTLVPVFNELLVVPVKKRDPVLVIDMEV